MCSLTIECVLLYVYIVTHDAHDADDGDDGDDGDAVDVKGHAVKHAVPKTDAGAKKATECVLLL